MHLFPLFPLPYILSWHAFLGLKWPMQSARNSSLPSMQHLTDCVFGSFFWLMNWRIISFTLCPFALVYSTFSNSGLVCVMSEPSHLQNNKQFKLITCTVYVRWKPFVPCRWFHCFALHVPAFFVLVLEPLGVSSPAPRTVHVSELVVRKIADHFARQEGGGVMGWVIRDPRIIWWGEEGGGLDPRGLVIRGPPTTHRFR